MGTAFNGTDTPVQLKLLLTPESFGSTRAAWVGPSARHTQPVRTPSATRRHLGSQCPQGGRWLQSGSQVWGRGMGGPPSRDRIRAGGKEQCPDSPWAGELVRDGPGFQVTYPCTFRTLPHSFSAEAAATQDLQMPQLRGEEHTPLSSPSTTSCSCGASRKHSPGELPSLIWCLPSDLAPS